MLLEVGPARRGRKGIGGAKTGSGKKTISLNALTHGCRSQEKILKGERREDYDALWTQWLDDYEPENDGDFAKVTAVVDADWRLQRTERSYTNVERALHEVSLDAAEWPEELLHRLQLMQRYRTSAENSLHKAVRLLEFIKARRDSEERAYQRRRDDLAQRYPAEAEAHKKFDELLAQQAKAAAEASRARQVFQGQHAVKPREKVVRLEQWAEIRVLDGYTWTELSPSNVELIAHGQRLMPPPNLVTRHLNFPDGVPAEYAWVGVRDAKQRARGMSGTQQMTVEAWLEVIEREAAVEGAHLLPAPRVVRQDDLDELCACPVCVMKVEMARSKWKV
jgi:hypothetical protein